MLNDCLIRFSFRLSAWVLMIGWLVLNPIEWQLVHAQAIPPIAPATTVQQPVFGVSVSPDGVMSQLQFAPPGGELFRQRAALAQASLNAELQQPAAMRKVSLARLQRAIIELYEKQLPLTDEINKLAGLQRIEFVFAAPERHDIILAGPAQGWLEDADGRAVGMFNRRPILLLEDLLTALRTFRSDRPVNIWVGCSIGQTPASMQRVKDFQRTIPQQISKSQELSVAQTVWQGLEDALGDGQVTVFGVSPKTNMAKVMIEADYRMKLIAIGREPPPIEMPVFFNKLKSVPRNNFQRWWFTPNYKCLEITDDRLALRISGQGIQLGTEEYKTDAHGRLIQLKGNPLPAAKTYAEAFTKRYSQIASVSPVFGQLRVMVDALLVANFIQREHLLDRTGLNLETLLDSNKVQIETQTTPTHAKSLANVKWESGVLIAPSGGVSIMTSEAFSEEMRLPVSAELKQAIQQAVPSKVDRWWWD